jgi:hypothetical protein
MGEVNIEALLSSSIQASGDTRSGTYPGNEIGRNPHVPHLGALRVFECTLAKPSKSQRPNTEPDEKHRIPVLLLFASNIDSKVSQSLFLEIV